MACAPIYSFLFISLKAKDRKTRHSQAIVSSYLDMTQEGEDSDRQGPLGAT